jgi:MFS family permease
VTGRVGPAVKSHRSSRQQPHGNAHHVGGAGRTVGPLLRVWGVWLLVMTGANLATPLYAVYAARFGFSSFVLTAIFAAYAFVLVPTLVFFGRLSDRFGRRPVIVAGLAVATLALAVFAAAQGTAWLFGARMLQGLAVGLISGPAAAALVELDPLREEQRPALFAGLAQAGGSGAGPALAGVLAQWAPAPRQLPFLVMIGMTAVAAAVALKLSEPAGTAVERWRIEWPRLPANLRFAFARVSVTAGLGWGALALCLSIVPKYASDLLRSQNLALLGAVAALALAASCGTQTLSRQLRLPLRGAQATGLVLLALGLVGLVIASPLHSLAILLIGSFVIGTGHGFSFLSAQHELNTIAPPEHRGEVTSAFIGCIYVVVATSVIASGILDRWFALATAVGAVALTLSTAAVVVAAWQAQPLER